MECRVSPLGFDIMIGESIPSPIAVPIEPFGSTLDPNVGDLIIRIGFGVYCTINIVRNPKTLF